MASNILEVQRMRGFQYMDEDSIDDELKCIICIEPFVDPGTMWSCDHVFCRTCIEKMVENVLVCPICRNSQRLLMFQKATRNLVNMLDKILVQCEYCNQINIQRGNFTEHINKLCPKVIVCCPADSNQCVWKGPRDQLDIHLTQCTAELRRVLLNEFMTVEKQIDQLQLNVRKIVLQRQQLAPCDKLNSEVMCLEQRCKILENSNAQLQSQLSKLDRESELLQKTLPAPKIVPPLRWINIHQNAKWSQNGHSVAGGNGQGVELRQLCNPYGSYIDDDQVMYIADSQNNRIVKWNCGRTVGEVVAGGNGKGDAPNQLNCPTDVTIDKDRESLIICDYQNRRVVRWPLRYGTRGETIISNIDCHGLAMDKNGFLYVTDYKQNEVRRYQIGGPYGRVVAGGNGKGNRLDQFNGPIYLFVGRDNSLYVSDEQNHRVMKWREGSKEGVVVAGGRQRGNGLEQLSAPAKVIVDLWNNVYVADWGNHRIMSWPQGASQGHVIVGENGTRSQWNQLKHPISLAFDSGGNLYVTNQWNHEVLKFDIVKNS